MRKKKPLTPDALKEKLRLDFLAACERGRTAEVETLIDAGANVNGYSPTGRTPLYYAVTNGHLETVKALIARGADVNAKMEDQMVNVFESNESAPLLLAAQRNFTVIAMLLLENGADVNAKDSFGLTALHFAAKRGNLELAAALVSRGADVRALDKWKHRPEYYALDNGDEALARFLIRAANPPRPPAPPQP